MSFGSFYTSRRHDGSGHDKLIPPSIEDSMNTATSSVSFFFHKFTRQAKSLFTDVPPEEEQLLEVPRDQGLGESLGVMFELTYPQRLTAFVASLLMGLVFLFIALSSATVMIITAPKKFVFFFTIGNLFSLLSTTFLVGVSAQFRAMFSAHRLEAAAMYCVAVILTFFFALVGRSSILCLISAIFQIACLLWYCLSFIPFARSFIRLLTSGSYAGGKIVQHGVSSVLHSLV